MARRFLNAGQRGDRPLWLGYLAAILCVLAMFALRLALTPAIGSGYAFITFYPGVVIAAWYGGLGPGILATVGSMAAGPAFMAPSQGTATSPQNQAAMALFGLSGIVISALGHYQLRARTMAEAAAREARRAIAALETSEERNRLAIQRALDAIIGMNSEGIITSWNPSAENMFGIPAEQAIGQRMSALIIPPRYREAHEQGLARYLVTGEGPVLNQRVKLSALRSDGQEFPVELTVTPLSVEGAVSFSAFLRDTTAEDVVSELQERLATTLRSIGDAVIAMDAECRITFVNPVAETLTGWTSDEVAGRSVDEIFRIINERTGEPSEAPYERVLKEGRIVGLANHTVLIRRDGSRLPIEDSAAPIVSASGAIEGIVLVFHDVSERKKREEILAYLADASTALSSSLDYRETLTRIAELATPRMADWAAVDMLDESGKLERLATSHVDAEKVRFVMKFSEEHPADPNSPYGSYNILRTGKPEYMPVIPRELLEAVATTDELREIIDSLALRSYIGVPLSVDGKPVGVLSFVYAESGRTYTEEDLHLAEQLAAHASTAIENARLYLQATTEIQERVKAEEKVRELNRQLQEKLEELARMALIVQSSDDAILSKDADLTITSWNPGAEKMYGYTSEEAIGKPIYLIVPPERAPEIDEIMSRLRSGRHIDHHETVRVRKDGTRLDVWLSIAPLIGPDGVFQGASVIARDITERKVAEEVQRQLLDTIQRERKDLERRVLERTAELQAANTELEAFSYSVSHDLRAPLRALDGFSRIMLDDYGQQLDAEAKDYLERIRGASQRMGQLIEDLLNLAYVTRTEMRREKVDLSSMLQTMGEELNARTDGPKVELEVEPQMVVDADPRLLRAAMENLMQNAWKFTSKKGGAKVQAGREAKNGKPAFFVRDNGAGFDQTYVSKLFQPFQRLHSTTEFAGTGIGLATVQRIIQRHGGKVWAEGEPGKGATFYFTL